jgi:hypothetical protein
MMMFILKVTRKSCAFVLFTEPYYKLTAGTVHVIRPPSSAYVEYRYSTTHAGVPSITTMAEKYGEKKKNAMSDTPTERANRAK